MIYKKRCLTPLIFSLIFSVTGTFRPRPKEEETISWPEHGHGMPSIGGWPSTGGKKPISKGSIKVRIEWNCEGEPSISIKTHNDSPYSSPTNGVNTREGREDEVGIRDGWAPF